MDEQLLNLVLGSLLHDVGKIIHRTGVMESHSNLGWDFLAKIAPFTNNNDIKECVKFHHGREISATKVQSNSLAYITYIADNISAAGDRRIEIIEGSDGNPKGGAIFDKSAPLSSVFNILNGNRENYTYKFRMVQDINYPVKTPIPNTTYNYMEVKNKLHEQLQGIEVKEEYINSVIHLLEITTSFIPSSTNTKELMDISLFDHSKTTAAIASCLYYYLGSRDNSPSYKEILFKNEKSFKEEEAFLLYSCDISGIQNFIYTISGTEALKSLRARSLYLEILIENIIDELLVKLRLSRCNLIYSGGGHAYALFPNTKKARDIIDLFDSEIKEWFLDNFDISIYLASGYATCTSNELSTNIGKVYQRVGKEVSKKKSNRYTASDIRKLNNLTNESHDRECRECKKSDGLNDEGLCDICQSLINISPLVIREDMYFLVEDNQSKNPQYPCLPLPFEKNLTMKTMEDARNSNYVRIYSKNNPSMGIGFATNLWVGDYTAKINNSKRKLRAKTFEEFSKESMGINRIAVLRADVDNLGKAFISGFKEQNNGEIVENSNRKYETISRTATLSRHLSMFFKYYLNDLLKSKRRNALVVYSGGDDMFIVGSWNDIIDLSKDVRDAFAKYTQGTLTISAGIGIYPHSFPISRIANEVGKLEEAAKQKDVWKNKVALFRSGKVDKNDKEVESNWILEWSKLPQIEEKDIIDNDNRSTIEEKLNIIRKVFEKDEQHGKSFLYNVLELFRTADKDKINIARYAYLLTRSESKNPRLNVKQFYEWILSPEQVKETEIAITLYSYETR